MCGIVGLWYLNQTQSVSPELIVQMTDILRHRGPNDEGYLLVNTTKNDYINCGGTDTPPALQLPDISQVNGLGYDLALGFRRLSILDISSAGHQPMSNSDGSLWIIFNGEIYNYIELRTELVAKGYTFHSGTDTEVILAAYETWGPDCLTRFNGMWSLVLWDSRHKQLFCARDRFGIKPFYYFWDGNIFAFASEIKALLEIPTLSRQPNDGVIHDYLRYNRLDHTEETFFQNIKRLLPSHFLKLTDTKPDIHRYWDIDPHRRFELAEDSIDATQFYDLFEDSVRIRLRSDVPVGTCLSGGLDSSSIVCVANKLLFADRVAPPDIVGAQQKTFSACAHDRRYDERNYIESVLEKTGAEANYTFLEADRLLSDISTLIWHQDEPFMSTSMYAQWAVMKLAAQRGVTVLLDGQGGDEILAGYHPYFDYFWGDMLRRGQWQQLWHELLAYRQLQGGAVPYLMARSLRSFTPVTLLGLARRYKRGGTLGLSSDFIEAYQHRVHEFVYRGQDPFHGFLYDTLMHISIPMLLRFEDRSSMAHSIETRLPFLDYRLVEYVFSLPTNQKIKDGHTKAILRRAMQGVLPEAIRTRTSKMGFVTPEPIWLANDLKNWVHDIIYSPSFGNRGYFDVPQIVQALEDHLNGRRNLNEIAWRWLNLELWFRQMIDKSHSVPPPISPTPSH